MIFTASSLAAVNAQIDLGKGIAYTGEDVKISVILTNPSHLAERDITVTLLLPQELGGNRQRNISVLEYQTRRTETSTIKIPSDAEPGNYPVNVEVAYSGISYTLREPKMLQVLKFPLELEVSLDPDTVQSRKESSLHITLRNTGSIDLENVSVQVDAGDVVSVEHSKIPIGLLLKGQENSLVIPVKAPNTPGSYVLTVVVRFDDVTGSHMEYKSVTLNVSRGFSLTSLILAAAVAALIIFLYKKFKG